MNDSRNKSIALVIDPKKYRIRIYKSILYSLNNPKYIQLLVNPEKQIVAIRAVKTDNPTDQLHKVHYSEFTDNCFEIYSRNFIITLCKVIGEIDKSYSYRITGEIMSSLNAAIFSLKTISEIR